MALLAFHSRGTLINIPPSCGELDVGQFRPNFGATLFRAWGSGSRPKVVPICLTTTYEWWVGL